MRAKPKSFRMVFKRESSLTESPATIVFYGKDCYEDTRDFQLVMESLHWWRVS